MEAQVSRRVWTVCTPRCMRCVFAYIFAAAFMTQSVDLGDCIVKFEIWDTAGQERYRSLAPMYYRWGSWI